MKNLNFKKNNWRKAKNTIITTLSMVSVAIAVIPLFLIFFYTLAQGITALNVDFFIHMPKPVGVTEAAWQMHWSERQSLLD